MKSNIKKSVSSHQEANGNITIEYKTARPVGCVTVIVIFLALCLLAGLFSPHNRYLYSAQQYQDQNAYNYVIGFFLLISILVLYLAKGNGITTVIPNEGLVFEDKKIAFDDIDTIGTFTNSNGTSYVYCVVGGTEISISSYVTKSVADNISRLIKEHSGCSWS